MKKLGFRELFGFRAFGLDWREKEGWVEWRPGHGVRERKVLVEKERSLLVFGHWV